ncbi:MAG: alpha/beta hydrolase [Actinomycetota bacterium]
MGSTDDQPTAGDPVDGVRPLDLDRRVDPEFAAALAARPLRGIRRLDQVRRAREVMEASRPPWTAPGTVDVVDHHAPAADDNQIQVRVYRPTDPGGGRPQAETRPALYWIHGGGLIVGSVTMDDRRSTALVEQLGITVASVEYRLAPEHPYPTPLEDCYAGLTWLVEHADELGIDTDRIAVGGASAGGGLAAGLALLARDRGGPPIRFQLLRYPMLDDRNRTPSSHAQLDPRVWHREANHLGWSAYLGDGAGSDGIEPYAAPGRASDLAGLPPAIVTVGDLDLFLDEDVDYARALSRAGVPTELHVYPGAYHGAINDNPDAGLTQRWFRDEANALVRALPEPPGPASA